VLCTLHNQEGCRLVCFDLFHQLVSQIYHASGASREAEAEELQQTQIQMKNQARMQTFWQKDSFS